MDELDRPTISAARLEEMFSGVRAELTTGLRPPPAAQLVRRAARRRRLRHGGITVLTGAVTCSLLLGWSLFSGGSDTGVSTSGSGAEHTLSPVIELPGPAPLSSGSAAATPTPQGLLLDQAGFSMLLPTEQLPTAAALYGPWTRLTENPTAVLDRGASAASSASPSASGTPLAPPLAPPLSAADQRANGASAVPLSISEGCAAALVERSGALRHWEFRYSGLAGQGAFAQQYLVEYDSPAAAASAGAGVASAGACTTDGSGWTVEDRTPNAVAVRLQSDRVLVEEITGQVVGNRLVVMMVERLGDKPTADVSVQGAFRQAAGQLADQARKLRAGSTPGSTPTASPSATPLQGAPTRG
ncbi:hypothetical protein CFP65_2431 [Kitasatospora sp. MMS16-BH015]|uniref:hypothetical protein n=1 Tax=Kitasatospora sp. MMS16-BH015 TaxID=2018025 RepID=UPI000CA2B54C|nr:hypothetical protein [Kitasatospora sp. MMS16-BH015]AUG77264.1 hypothetical protein CFP65_2431 [Kitasatospora sp. MMS16-BH015]